MDGPLARWVWMRFVLSRVCVFLSSLGPRLPLRRSFSALPAWRPTRCLQWVNMMNRQECRKSNWLFGDPSAMPEEWANGVSDKPKNFGVKIKSILHDTVGSCCCIGQWHNYYVAQLFQEIRTLHAMLYGLKKIKGKCQSQIKYIAKKKRDPTTTIDLEVVSPAMSDTNLLHYFDNKCQYCPNVTRLSPPHSSKSLSPSPSCLSRVRAISSFSKSELCTYYITVSFFGERFFLGGFISGGFPRGLISSVGAYQFYFSSMRILQPRAIIILFYENFITTISTEPSGWK